jgi:hypothetical protein
MHNRILFYSEALTNRLRYTVQLVFADVLGLDIVFTQSESLYQSVDMPKINYSVKPFEGDKIYIRSTGLLSENTIIVRDYTADFPHYDILSRIFFLVTRYEEYIASSHTSATILDAHGRFPSTASVLKKHNLLRQPVVNQWIIDIEKEILKNYPYLEVKKRVYQYQATYDIDQAWAFKNKGFKRTIGGIFKDILRGLFPLALKRVLFLLGLGRDPDYNFDYMEELHKKYDLKPIYFWLIGDYGPFDKNINWQNRAFRYLIKNIFKKYPIGIHPSYKSNEDINILKMEIARLVDITAPLSISRQHYLRLHLPDTYRRLLSVGITADYSMGYADDIGFRAGIATPYIWYDLDKELITNLKIFPFSVMEVTLQQYLKLTPDEAIAEVMPLIQATQSVGGQFVTLWHNTSLSDEGDWEGWRRVYETILETATASKTV